ncbi:putative phage abortive infection protein [Flavobacterium frigidarium]|uniref:putative phage abortive infection protein n=1 Tax=Flavobacterium frigidarium TaxID=99286 RepID=UPI0030D740D6|tara:strand:- start:19351 stop:20496 length:1146 start_codon:yes stop_codon:yes gene_type:complete
MALVAIIFLAIILVSIILGKGLFFKTYSKLLIAALILLLSFLVLLFFTAIHSIDVLDNAKDYGEIGPYGDYIGGILNPLIAVFAVFAAGFAFYAQYEANKQVQDQFKIQQFESQFFEMLRLHKENVNEMKITGYDSVIQETLDNEKKVVQIVRSHNTKIIEGRKVFVSMVVKLISCYEFLEEINSTWRVRYDPVDLLKLSYRIFFFGSNSELIILEKIDVDFIDHVKKQLRKHRKRHRDSYSRKNVYQGLNKKIELFIKYSPFTGHENRLGHYYRHLYSTVKYVVNKEREGLIDYKQSRGYLKILRSQMSNDEQLMLYYNYIIGFGKDWENDGYLTKYRMLHNLPIDKVKYAENPRVHFQEYINSIKPGEGHLFEWGDVEQ